MEDIVLERTAKTPAIRFLFSENRLEITGVSIPEDADSFYSPLMEWVDQYVENKKNQKTTFVLKLIYFNTSTSDYLVTMLKNLKKIQPEDSQLYLYDESMAEIDNSEPLEVNGHHANVESGVQVQVPEDQDSELNDDENPNENASEVSEENKREHLLRIEWFYEEEDEDMRETGSHFESIIDLPFVFESCEEIE